MAENRGKQFEDVVKEAFEKVPDLSIDRLHDQTTGFKGSSNICDFILYKKPFELYLECKSCHGNTLSINSNNPKNLYGAISNTQWEGLSEKSKIPGVIAGVLVWFIDKDVTVFYSIEYLRYARGVKEFKSIRFDDTENGFVVPGKKKRVFFDYDMQTFWKEVTEWLQ